MAMVNLLTSYMPLSKVGAAIVAVLIASQALRSEEHTSELQSRLHLVCRLLLEKKKYNHFFRANLARFLGRQPSYTPVTATAYASRTLYSVLLLPYLREELQAPTTAIQSSCPLC